MKAGKKLSGMQQVSEKKPDPAKLNRHLDETCKFYKESNKFTRIEGTKKEEAETSPQKNSEGEEKKFLLEGKKDNLFVLLPETSYSGTDGPVYPTLKQKLFPALDTLEKTIGELGENPTPAEVDRSNIRRLIRAFQPVAEAFEGSYDKKDFKKAMGRIQKLAGTFGKFKDVSVVETELKAISPDGKISPEIRKKLEEHRKEEEKAFQDTYRDFQEKGMEKSLEVLRNPEPPKKKKEEKIAEKDRKKLAKNMEELMDRVEEKGLVHRDPEQFHEGRKSMRKLLNAMNSGQDTFGFSKEDVNKMTVLVDVYGQAQDKNIAFEWLNENGFKKEADTMKTLYEDAQRKALTEAEKFIKSGTFERVRKIGRASCRERV